MTTSTTIATSTLLQRNRIRTALRERGLPIGFVTDEHSHVLDRAGIKAEYGTSIVSLLRSISYSAAARLLAALREEAIA